jgi:signal transduction histidine kinase
VDQWRASVHPDDLDRIAGAREASLKNRSLYAVEYRVKRRDSGETVWLAVFGRWYYNEVGEGVRILGVSFDITPRKELERQLLETMARAQRHIGQELHDGAGQELTGLGLMAQALAQRLPEGGPEQRLALRLVSGLDQLHSQVRALARGLVPVEVEVRGLRAALQDLASSTSEQSGVPVTFECPEGAELPDHTASVELYRIAQEAVSNALRHGRPRRIELALLPQQDRLALRIKDNGVGMRSRPGDGKGLGIRIMEYRAALIGGVLRIRPADGGGTVVTVTLPRRKGNGDDDSGTPGPEKNPDRG